MKILDYRKKDRGSQMGEIDILVNIEYDGALRPFVIKGLKQFRSKKTGKVFVAWPSHKNWDHPDQPYEDTVHLQEKSDSFAFSEKVLALLNVFLQNQPQQEEDDDEELF